MTSALSQLQAALANHYRIERELGRGGMATVWMAQDLRHQRSVALKVLHPELAAGLGPERFLREVHLAARLQHPHILPLFDSGAVQASDGMPELFWYTMPYVEGESLRTRLARERQLPLEEALRIAREVAEALGYAHEQGVIHRDIKPENILLSRGHPLLADFGIARALDPVQHETLTGTGVAIGTPAYMSPEQAMGDRDLDGRSDVYSLGCVLYEMIAGEPPHTGPSPQAVVAKRLLDPMPEIERCRPGISPSIRSVVRRALATMPVDRYTTAGDFARAIAVAEAGAATGAAPSREVNRGYRKRVGAAIIVAFISAVALALVIRGLRRPEAVTVREPLRLAVLPFENLGDSEQAYLTDGIADGVRGKLAKLSMLQVISGSSTEEYRRTRKPMRQIGHELGVPYVLVGKVRWDQDRTGGETLQLRPELIQTATGSTRALSSLQSDAAGLPQLQTKLALGITEALGMELGEAERASLSDTLTANPEAYAAYLRGREYLRRVAHYDAPTQLLAAAVELFQRAVALDTSFALAKVGLAEAHRLAGLVAGGDPTRYRRADSLLAGVLKRWPDLPEALAARGDIRRDHEDLDAATRLYERAVSLKPGDAGLLARLTFLQALRLDSAALRTGARAVSLAPRDPEILRRVIAGISIFRHFDELERYSDRLIALDPSDMFGYAHKALAQLLARGDTAAAVRTLRTAEEMQGKTPFLIAWVYTMCGPSGWQRWHRLTLNQLASPDLQDSLMYFWYHAQIAAAEGRNAAKRAYADSIVRIAPALNPQTPNYGYELAILSYGEAARGNRAEARRSLARAEAALRRMGPSGQAMLQVGFVAANAELGDVDRAIAGTRWVLEEPTPYNKHVLRLSPEFAGLWRQPQFVQLMADTTLP